MKPGPDQLYECPKCSNRIQRGSMMSGNTFGARLYSDGRMDAPMMPSYPNLIACNRCRELLWLDRMKPIAYSMPDFLLDDNSDSDGMHPWGDVQIANEMSIPVANRILQTLKPEFAVEEYYIRRKLWWGYHERIDPATGKWKNSTGGRHDFIYSVQLHEEDHELYEANCRALIAQTERQLHNWGLLAADDDLKAEGSLLDELRSEKFYNCTFTLCELHRNLGQFEQAESVLARVSDESYASTVEQFMAAIARRDKYPFLFDE